MAWEIALAAAAFLAVITPALNEDPEGKVGQRPYEMVQAGRDEPAHPQLVDFEDLSGWTVEAPEECQAQLVRTREKPLFGRYVARLSYKPAKSAGAQIVIRPPQPIQIPGRFQAVNLWIHGDSWGWVSSTGPFQRCFVLVEDARGRTFRLDMGLINYDYWFLAHCTAVSPDGRTEKFLPLSGPDEPVEWPLKFAGLLITGVHGSRPRRLYFDALSFYTPEYKPLKLAPEPENLPWPTTPDTIVPVFKRRVRVSIRQAAGKFIFEASDGRDRIVWIYQPRTGTLSDISCRAGGLEFRPCAGGGIKAILGGQVVKLGGEEAPAELVRAARVRDRVVARWRARRGTDFVDYEISLRPRGKALVVEVSELAPPRGGKCTEFVIGGAEGLPEPKLIRVPYLYVPPIGPSPVMAGRIFLLGVLDWYVTNASSFYGQSRISGGVAYYNGGARYDHLTDGSRNRLHERLVLAVSSDFQEVLPNIPNPRSDTIDQARKFLWRNIGSPQPELLKRLKAHGVDYFTACLHEVGWRDAGESYTLRLQAAPRIGDEGMKQFSRFVRSLGYRFGLYTNYIDYAPVNANWDEDKVCLLPDGEWRRAWPRTYALKPAYAPEFEAYYAPRINEKFGTSAGYCDVHTCVSLGSRVDFDARVPGAGMLRAQFNAYARVLWNESKAHKGPVFSEGINHWFYAGICDGNYAQIGGPDRWRVAPIVDFDLLQIHPKETDFGMGMPSMFYGRGGRWSGPDRLLSDWFDRFIASTIAFGHIGFLALEWGFDGALKSYYMVQAAQERYAGVEAARIAYVASADGAKLVDTSTALRTGALEKFRSVYVAYRNGVRVWANLSSDWKWPLDLTPEAAELLGARRAVLPPAGYLVVSDDLVVFSGATRGGHRFDVVRCPAYTFLDTRGEWMAVAGLMTRGRLAAKPQADGSLELIPCTAADTVTFRPRAFGLPEEGLTATAVDVDGKVLGSPQVRLGSSGATIVPVKGAVKYIVRAGRGAGGFGASVKWLGALTALGCPAIAPGEEASIQVAVENRGGGKVLAGRVEIEGPMGQSPRRVNVVALDADALSRRGGRQVVRAKLPAAAKPAPGERLWWQIRIFVRTEEGEQMIVRWADAVATYPLRLAAEDVHAEPGGVVKWPMTLMCALSRPIAVRGLEAQCSGLGAKIVDAPKAARLGPGQSAQMALELRAPGLPSSHRIELSAAGRTVAAAWICAEPLVEGLPLLEMGRIASRGICIRGQAERELESPYDAETGAIVEERDLYHPQGQKRGIFMHPPYKTGVGYSYALIELKLPPWPAKLRFDLGFLTGSTTEDGCLFQVFVIDGGRAEKVFERIYADTSRWARCEADLSKWAGRAVTLKLVTDVGPNDNSHSDWAAWGDLMLVPAGRCLRLRLAGKPAAPWYSPPPAGQRVTEADLKSAKRAWLVFEAAGVEAREPYISTVLVNGAVAGTLPASRSGDRWGPEQRMEISRQALQRMGLQNTVVIRNPGRDCYKLRRLRLEVELADGRKVASATAIGPFCSDRRWLYAEGHCVELGQDLLPLWLDFTR